LGDQKMMIHDIGGLGRMEVTTLPLPEFANDVSATYTYSGKVLVSYKTVDDPQDKDYWRIAVVNDDGSDFRDIFSGSIPQHKKANGIRYMPFADHKRVLLGDYVLECDPDVDTCQRAELISVRYPWQYEQDPRTMNHWSEIIIAPDNEHIAWTILRTDIGAAVGLGVLKRTPDGYIIEQAQIISTLGFFEADKDNPGYLVMRPMRGGEVKQFVGGGTAISLVGAKDGAITDTVVQELLSGEVTQITRTPGYDETTIFSPDECLGIVMSTRGSKKTDPAVLGLLPRPRGGLVVQGLAMHLYMYAVAGVRSFRKGNIGPVLIDIQRSMHEPGYQGVLLNDPGEAWVYCSPMSWHPDGKKAMWMEMVRGSGSITGIGRQMRVRKVELFDYHPKPPVSAKRTPDAIPYGLKGDAGAESLRNTPSLDVEGKIAGKHSGHIAFARQGHMPAPALMGSIQATYVNFSDDGKTFYHGYEKAAFSFMDVSVYEADLVMSGEQQGEMKLRVTFSPLSFEKPPKLLFEPAPDGKPKSYGYASYNGIRLNVEDLLE
jgi:hypothetical protein